jgi:hypothetical protein
MDHYIDAVDLLKHGEPLWCDVASREADANLVLLAALVHATLALADAIEGTSWAPWRNEEAS